MSEYLFTLSTLNLQEIYVPLSKDASMVGSILVDEREHTAAAIHCFASWVYKS